MRTAHLGYYINNNYFDQNWRFSMGFYRNFAKNTEFFSMIAFSHLKHTTTTKFFHKAQKFEHPPSRFLSFPLVSTKFIKIHQNSRIFYEGRCRLTGLALAAFLDTFGPAARVGQKKPKIFEISQKIFGKNKKSDNFDTFSGVARLSIFYSSL